EAKGISLDVSADALDWLADKGYEPEFGARPLRRVIQRELDDRIADLLVTEAVDEGGRIRAAVVDGELRVEAGTRPNRSSPDRRVDRHRPSMPSPGRRTGILRPGLFACLPSARALRPIQPLTRARS